MIMSSGACGDIKPLALSPNPSVIVQIKGEVEKNPKRWKNFPDAVVYLVYCGHHSYRGLVGYSKAKLINGLIAAASGTLV